jgi:drug/metabolite transporter (DMT)-like permease
MTSARNLQWKTYALLAPIVFFAASGNVLLGKGMKQVGGLQQWSPAALAALFANAFTSGWIWLGIGSLLLFLIMFMVVLSWADYSFVMPVSAASYALVPLMSGFFLGEKVSPLRWTGVALICAGLALVTRTPASGGERS